MYHYSFKHQNTSGENTTRKNLMHFLFFQWVDASNFIAVQKVDLVKQVNRIFYLHIFASRKNMCLSEPIALVFLFIPSTEKPNEQLNVSSLWTSTRKNTDKKSHCRLVCICAVSNLTYHSSQKNQIASGFNQTVRKRNTGMRTLYISNKHS